jgi:hypothetical protein
VGVDDAGYLIGSSPSWGLAGWQPTLFLEGLKEVPGGNYERIPPHTFAVPAATIVRARELADALSHRKEASSSSGPP